MFYLTTHSTHFIYGYMASDIWLRTILIVRKETRCRHIGHSLRLTARVLLYALSHRQDRTYHGLCYTSRGALAGTRNSSMGSPHEGSIRRPIAPWANALTTELHLALYPRVHYRVLSLDAGISTLYLPALRALTTSVRSVRFGIVVRQGYIRRYRSVRFGLDDVLQVMWHLYDVIWWMPNVFLQHINWSRWRWV